MFDLIASILAFFYGLVHSYGLAIVLLTLVVMAVTAPFTYKGTKSMIQMQRLQPQLKAIQAKHRDDREKMNQEMLAFYKANNLNPVGGCLPMLIQIPVFLVLYRVVSGLTARMTDIGLQGGFTAMQFSQGTGSPPFTRTPDIASNGEPLMARADYFNPAYISHDSELWQDLRGTTEMTSWGIDLSESASKALSTSITHALPYLALIAIVLVTGVIQQRQIQGRQAKSATSSPINSQQQMIMKVMPFFLPIFSFTVPAALVVYFVVSNLWRIGQQAFITHKLYGGEPAAPIETTVVDEDDAAPASTKSKPGKAGAKPAETSDRSERSPMGRNRRANGADGSNGTTAPRKNPAKPKPKPDRTPTSSGRVTPPGSGGTRARKKKRT
jgi:YidC/Oxa1 family membrane protein insertase